MASSGHIDGAVSQNAEPSFPPPVTPYALNLVTFREALQTHDLWPFLNLLSKAIFVPCHGDDSVSCLISAVVSFVCGDAAVV